MLNQKYVQLHSNVPELKLKLERYTAKALRFSRTTTVKIQDAIKCRQRNGACIRLITREECMCPDLMSPTSLHGVRPLRHKDYPPPLYHKINFRAAEMWPLCLLDRQLFHERHRNSIRFQIWNVHKAAIQGDRLGRVSPEGRPCQSAEPPIHHLNPGTESPPSSGRDWHYKKNPTLFFILLFLEGISTDDGHDTIIILVVKKDKSFFWKSELQSLVNVSPGHQQLNHG